MDQVSKSVQWHPDRSNRITIDIGRAQARSAPYATIAAMLGDASRSQLQRTVLSTVAVCEACGLWPDR